MLLHRLIPGVRFEDAPAWAARLHAGQVRKGTDTPYVSHLLSVAAAVLEHGGDEDMAIAARMQDAAEDQGGREILGIILERHGHRVARIVEDSSDMLENPKPPWRAPQRAVSRPARSQAAGLGTWGSGRQAP